MRRLIWFITLAAEAAVIDRIAVTVGNQVITRSDIDRQLRVAAFLDGKPVTLTSDELRAAAERLVEQSIIRREISIGDYPPAPPALAGEVLSQVKRERFGARADAYQEALRAYGISEPQLRAQLEWQLNLLRFIDQRFRTGVQIPGEDAVAYYRERFAPDWRKARGTAPPPFSEAREEIERILTEQQVGSLVDRWLAVARTQTEIRFREAAFEVAP
jgi:hypothetical protein